MHFSSIVFSTFVEILEFLAEDTGVSSRRYWSFFVEILEFVAEQSEDGC